MRSQSILVGQCSSFGYRIADELKDITATAYDTHIKVQTGPFENNSRLYYDVNLGMPDWQLRASLKAIQFAKETYPVVINEQPIYMDHMVIVVGEVYSRETHYSESKRIYSVRIEWSLDNGYWDMYVIGERDWDFMKDYETREEQIEHLKNFPPPEREQIELNEYLRSLNPSLEGIQISQITDGWLAFITVRDTMNIHLHKSPFFFNENPWMREEHMQDLTIKLED